ncbi:hypothetical protein DNI29_09015 [Hymenobacter sediminis]|uniref:hypothetical protein n=1 Tax=Hymenobacter sediminis TaxID=2218621 RepID=UPI000F4FD3EE|nr:hypothetical protein [Hymenobacter sediminis]RPD47587.1 hypothetical protein DNI29_09015 [Hymenobacter sediminis]
MKKLLTLFCFLSLSAVSASAQEQQTSSIQALDEQYGFHGARFESSVNSYKGLALAEKGGDTRFYRRPTDVKTMGEGELSSIRYGFYKGKLAMVILETKGLTNSRAVLAALVAQYGPGAQNNPYQQRFAWNGKEVTMSYDENAGSNDATIFISSKKLRAMQLKEQSKAGIKLGGVPL